MDKRVIVFLALSVTIILGYEYLLNELGLLPETAVSEPADQPTTEESPSHADTRNLESQAPPLQVASGESSPKPIADNANVQEVRNELTVPEVVEVETNLYRAKFTSRGAALTSWELKQYRSTHEAETLVQLVRQGSKFAQPLIVTTDDPALTKELGQGVYRVSKDFTTLDQEHPTGHVTFSYENPGTGARLQKQFTFHADSYVVDMELVQSGFSASAQVELGTNFGIVDWGEGFIGSVGAASLVDDKIEKGMPDGELERKGTVKWVALQDKYFISALMPKHSSSTVANNQGEKLVSTAVRLQTNEPGTPLLLQLYAGPKEHDTLEHLQVGLEDTIDFGWFLFGSWDTVRAIAKPIFHILRWINEYTHNYGLTIILLTVGIKVLFVPLQYKSYKSMKQMQTIQPKVMALQEKLKDDRERLNRELIKLYRDQKVNPVGGCLPMVLQMPVFVALFNILYMTIDLRQAPLGLWISDLSVQDPYYILPIIMGVSMFVMQKIQPTTMDPNQAKIMLLLPVFMTFLFINFPAGLVLYWLTNNVLSIVQQFVTDRFFFKNRPILPNTEVAEGKK
ncbi:MAG: membrane protein insertase YidC [Nitrospira sp.]|nr:membrane protein insertase YidC [Nitrospira sp.]